MLHVRLQGLYFFRIGRIMMNKLLGKPRASQWKAHRIAQVYPITLHHLGTPTADRHEEAGTMKPMRLQHPQIDQPGFFASCNNAQRQFELRLHTVYELPAIARFSNSTRGHRFNMVDLTSLEGRRIASEHTDRAIHGSLGQSILGQPAFT